MDLKEAFKHFVENIAPHKYKYDTVYAWKTRMKEGKISDERMAHYLKENGYTHVSERVVASPEQWYEPGAKIEHEFVIMFLDPSGVGVDRITAPDLFQAYEKVREANPERKNLTDVTNATVDAIAKRINDVLQFGDN